MKAYQFRLLLATMIIGVVASAQPVNASAITGMTIGSAETSGGNFATASASTVAAPGLANKFVNPFNAVYHGGDTPPLHANYVNLTSSITDLHQPITQTTTVTDNGQSSLYYYTVTMTNNVTTHAPIQPVTFKLLNSTLAAGDFSQIVFNYAEDPTSTYQPWSDPAGLTAQSLTFGGLSGGGGELSFGQTATFHFSVYVPDIPGMSGNFILQMTPNPEPGSLALAGLAGIGGLFLKRRRITGSVVC